MQDLPLAPIDRLPRNVVFLTHGWSGSSVFTALLADAGHSTGAATVAKPDYDTFENADLVALNERLLAALAPGLDREHRFDAADVQAIAQRAGVEHREQARAFVEACDAHRPWVWKDPRLTWTLRVIAPCLDLRRTRFVVLTREPMQAWITANLRRHVQSHAFTRRYNDGITASNLAFLREHGLPALTLSFEDLLLRPEPTLAALGDAAGVVLTLERLRAVCRLPLGRRSRGWRDALLAALVYLKNRDERDGRRRPVALAGRA